MPQATTPSTVDRILDGALAQLELHGVRRTTMDDIARAAGVSRPTLYGYFPNKGAIIRATFMRELDRFLARMDEVGQRAESPDDKVVAIAKNAYLELREHRLLQRLLGTEQEVIMPFVTGDAPGLVIGYDWAARQIARSFGRPEPEADDYAAAEVLVRAMHSLVLSPPVHLDLDTPEAVEGWARTWLAPVLGRASRDGPGS